MAVGLSLATLLGDQTRLLLVRAAQLAVLLQCATLGFVTVVEVVLGDRALAGSRLTGALGALGLLPCLGGTGGIARAGILTDVSRVVLLRRTHLLQVRLLRALPVGLFATHVRGVAGLRLATLLRLRVDVATLGPLLRGDARAGGVTLPGDARLGLCVRRSLGLRVCLGGLLMLGVGLLARGFGLLLLAILAVVIVPVGLGLRSGLGNGAHGQYGADHDGQDIATGG